MQDLGKQVSIRKQFWRRHPSLHRKAGATELSLFRTHRVERSCPCLFGTVGKSADRGQEVRQHQVAGIQTGSRLGVNKCLHGRDRWGQSLQHKAAEKGTAGTPLSSTKPCLMTGNGGVIYTHDLCSSEPEPGFSMTSLAQAQDTAGRSRVTARLAAWIFSDSF